MDRFTAFLLIRRFLKHDPSRNHALAVEAIMEELAGHAGSEPASWGVLGLLSQLDLEYAAHNPRARGQRAREQAELEGLAPELAASLARWCSLPPLAEPAQVEDALFLASHLAEAALGPPLDEGAPLELDDSDSGGRGLEDERPRSRRRDDADDDPEER